jgi:uncharacterized RDD family membrane protein YckC
MPSFANLKRRLIVLIYEALLVFAVIFFADLLFSLSVQSFSFHQEALRHIRQLFLFIVIGVYFVYCWTKKGQTLAMKTWRIKIVNKDFHLISVKQAIARYIVSWMWFAPALLVNTLFHFTRWESIITLTLGMLIWGSLSLFTRHRQFLHDVCCKTYVINA